MRVHYTGRQVDITRNVRSQVEEKLNKLHRHLGWHLDLEAHVIIELERHFYTTEVTLNLKGNHSLVGVASAPEIYPSVQESLDRLDTQVHKYKDRGRERKRRTRAALVTKTDGTPALRRRKKVPGNAAAAVETHDLPEALG